MNVTVTAHNDKLKFLIRHFKTFFKPKNIFLVEKQFFEFESIFINLREDFAKKIDKIENNLQFLIVGHENVMHVCAYASVYQMI